MVMGWSVMMRMRMEAAMTVVYYDAMPHSYPAKQEEVVICFGGKRYFLKLVALHIFHSTFYTNSFHYFLVLF